MAASNNKATRKHVRSEGAYSSQELRQLTLDDGTRVVSSPTTNIKRPVCAGIDVHKEIVTCYNHETKGLNLDNIRTFLGEHGADAETLRLVKSQCSNPGAADGTGQKTGTIPSNKKQPRSSAKTTVVPQQDAGRKRSHKSPETKLPNTSASTATA